MCRVFWYSLDTLSVPVGRLKSCRHCFCMYVELSQSYDLNRRLMFLYVCRECIKESLKHSKACPTCKCEVTRRDVETDEVINGFVSHMKVLDGLKDSLVPAMKALEAPGDERGREEIDKLMLPWVQGVRDDEYNSPSESFSGSALEQLRKRKSSRSPSPCSPGTTSPRPRSPNIHQSTHARRRLLL